MGSAETQSTPGGSGTDRVYLDLYGLTEPPFSITPDPEFLYLSHTHEAVLEKVLYGIDSRMGFLLLTGEVGTGKTTICRHILDVLAEKAETVYIVNPAITGKELLCFILDDLGIPYPSRATKKQLLDLLNRFLLCPVFTKPVVIIIDDAQSMPGDTLENLRLLSNLETDKAKLLQILLVGQPELVERLAEPRMRQLRQRISLHCQLELLSVEETEEYITRRLYASGNQGRLRFDRGGVKLVHRHSGGVPRLMNKICDYALVAGYVDNEFTIGRNQVRRALQEIRDLNIGREQTVCGKKATPLLRLVTGLTLLLLCLVWALVTLGSGLPEWLLSIPRP